MVVEGEAATVEDLGSKNGTLVQGQRVQTATTVAHGDELLFGNVKARFVIDRRDDPTTITL